MSRFEYIPEYLDFLKSGYMTMNTRDLTVAFNKKFDLDKTETDIHSVLTNNKIRCGRKGKSRLQLRKHLNTPEQEKFITENYTGRSVTEMTALFNKRFDTLRTRQQIKTFVHSRGITSGRTGHFRKGHKPWNMGTKGVMKPNSGNFKKGSVPANTKPLGYERICPKDGFILIKIAERNPHTGCLTRFRHKQIYIWEQKNGPVPEGMVVAFKDSDKTNCELDNLMLISRAELLKLNKNSYREAPVELKPSIMALSKLQVKTDVKQRELKST